MGFYSSLTAEKYDRQYSDSELIKRMTSYFKSQILNIAGIVVTVLVISGTGALQPWIVSKSADLMQATPTILQITTITGAVFLIGTTGWL
ncbi:MAG: hypothetical protein H3C48_21120, partial [Chitinophagaceae bacterium]|nr:hypothetical protein [Chitinophagaceae bacterium]